MATSCIQITVGRLWWLVVLGKQSHRDNLENVAEIVDRSPVLLQLVLILLTQILGVVEAVEMSQAGHIKKFP